MAKITKRIRGIPVNSRVQTWDTASDKNDEGSDIVADDIFDVETSLGYAASHVTFQVAASGTAIAIRLNPTVTLYPPRPAGEMGYVDNPYPWVASGVSFIDTSANPIVIEDGTTFSFENEVPVKDIQIVSADTSFKLIVS